jgi:hypothetical protein
MQDQGSAAVTHPVEEAGDHFPLVIATDQRHRCRASVLRAVPAMIRIKSSRPDRRWLTLVTYHRSCSHAHG